MVSLAYGAATSSWSFNTRTGKKALMITGGGALNPGDAYVSQRLSNTFGFDVKVKSDSGITLADADGVALIYNSSTVNSGLVAPANFENLAIPLINSESANTDDFKLLDLPYGGFGNGPSTMTMTIVNADHPITQGFATGPIQMFTANVQQHYGRAPSGGLSLMANAAQDHLYVIELGSAVIDAEGEFIHPARRVHFGTGNDGAGLLTDEGKVLFDRVITWALGTPVPDAKPENLTISRNPRDGVVTLVWTSLPGRKYRIESSLILEESTWPALDPAFVATASESMFIDNAAGTDPKRYYRIRLRP